MSLRVLGFLFATSAKAAMATETPFDKSGLRRFISAARTSIERGLMPDAPAFGFVAEVFLHGVLRLIRATTAICENERLVLA